MPHRFHVNRCLASSRHLEDGRFLANAGHVLHTAQRPLCLRRHLQEPRACFWPEAQYRTSPPFAPKQGNPRRAAIGANYSALRPFQACQQCRKRKLVSPDDIHVIMHSSIVPSSVSIWVPSRSGKLNRHSCADIKLRSLTVTQNVHVQHASVLMHTHAHILLGTVIFPTSQSVLMAMVIILRCLPHNLH